MTATLPAVSAPDDAARAAAAAGVEVRLIDSAAECARASELFAEVWGAVPGATPMDATLLRAMSFTGSYVAAAYGESGAMLGASAALFSAGPPLEIHSHITGILRSAQARGLGGALKLHQRAWALDHGIHCCSWTYDPLVRANAHFNLARLGARVCSYLPDFYGDMRDSLNAGAGSDRIFVTWDLTAPVGGPRELPAGEPVLVEDGGRPVRRASSAPVRTVVTPANVNGLRRTDPALAGAWRIAVRDTLVPLLDAGWQVAGFAAGAYVLTAP